MPAKTEYLVLLNGKIEGPYTMTVLRGKILDGSIPEASEIQEVAGGSWRPIQDLFDQLFPSWR